MKQWNILAATLVTAGLFASAADATIIYSVDRTIGEGSVKGTITTDGTLGRLPTNCGGSYFGCRPGSPFVDWDLTLNDGENVFTLTGEDDTYLWAWSGDFEFVDTTFYATESNLVFDFDSPGVALFEWNHVGLGNPLWQIAGPGPNNETGSELVSADSFTGSVIGPRVSRTGQQVIGWATTWEVPGPSSMAILAIGLAGIAGSRRLKRS